jgi:hypothetical protein
MGLHQIEKAALGTRSSLKETNAYLQRVLEETLPCQHRLPACIQKILTRTARNQTLKSQTVRKNTDHVNVERLWQTVGAESLASQTTYI